MKRTIEERLRARTIVDANGCWLFQGTKDNGYGKMYVDGRRMRAHRLSYEIAKGPIPSGLSLDHLCRQRSCIRPDHMEPVDGVTNVMRGEGPAARRARQTHCKRGHALSGENLVMRVGWNKRLHRECRVCKRARNKATRQRHRQLYPEKYNAMVRAYRARRKARMEGAL